MSALKKKKKIRDDTPDHAGPLGSYLTAKECPKCGAKLYDELYQYVGLAPWINYVCGKCGYDGQIALNPSDGKKKDKKRFEKAVRDMKTFMKKKTGGKKESSPVLGSYLTEKECPKCGAKLYHEILGGLTRYICGKCGYFGPVALDPLKKDSKKKFKKAVNDMKKFMKSEKRKK